ncbi:hypothetical protein POG20_18680 [Blautia wexlerae]|nr:hypothetical protein [Blautia wexlerae]
MKKIKTFSKKGVDKRGWVWYYSQAPYGTAQTKGRTVKAGNPRREAGLDGVRTLKIKQRERKEEPVMTLREKPA